MASFFSNCNRHFMRIAATNCCRSMCTTVQAQHAPIGFVGLGHMGSKMVRNMAKDGKKMIVFDASDDAINSVVSSSEGKVVKGSLQDIASKCRVVLSMLPNDAIVADVSHQLLKAASEGTNANILHISCSTISPTSARKLADVHRDNGHTLVTAPVFARPDGIAKRQATWMVGGPAEGREVAQRLLSTKGTVVDMGDDVGAANVVKLCGNFLIASSIEAIGEAMVLAEKNGVDQRQVMSILSSSIFDCLIYKGYGQRVSERDHRPGGFSLELGLKDVSLVSQTARETDTPMPFLSVLLDRYVSAKAKGRKDFDWSAIGLGVAEEAGVDVSADVRRNEEDIRNGNLY